MHKFFNIKSDSMKTPYKKPRQLSDPYKDFTKKELDSIIKCENQNLGYYEYSCIYQKHLPAGKYSECAYYIPYVLNFIRTNNKDRDEIADIFLHWCCTHASELIKDSLLDEILINIETVFRDAVEECSSSQIKNKDSILYPCNAEFISSVISSMKGCDIFKIHIHKWLKFDLTKCKLYYKCQKCYVSSR